MERVCVWNDDGSGVDRRLPRVLLFLGLWVCLALVVCLPSASASPPDRCGKLTSDATIGSERNPLYVVTCDLTVGAGTTLTIEPGTVVKVAMGRKLIVEGKLVAGHA